MPTKKFFFHSGRDFVNFGCAPALILYSFVLHNLKSLGWIVALIFARHPPVDPVEHRGGDDRDHRRLELALEAEAHGCEPPALILYSFVLHNLKSLGWIVALIFAIAMALRLAAASRSARRPGPACRRRSSSSIPAGGDRPASR
jgi:hypothetical protein